MSLMKFRALPAAIVAVVTVAILGLFGCLMVGPAEAFTVNVVDTAGNPVSGFRWLVERDNTNQSPPGVVSTDSISLSIHNSHAPVEASGHAEGSSTVINLPRARRHFVSVLPDADGGGALRYTMGGAPVAPKQDTVTVTVHSEPIPTAQITVIAFADQNPINNGWDDSDPGIGGAQVVISDNAGQISLDAFGNPLGTRYNPDGTVLAMGSGLITTLTQDEFDTPGMNPYNLKVGEAVIKYIAPGKYGVVVIPPVIDDDGYEMQWIQTTTVEGSQVIDAWVKANEPNVFVEGFGTGFKHVVFGFIKLAPAHSTFKGSTYDVLPWNAASPGGSATIEGTLRWNHFAKPPNNQGFFPGQPVPEAWVALNDPLAQPGVGDVAGKIIVPCDENGHFVLNDIPAGTYTLIWFDRPLDGIFGFASVTVADGEVKQLGDILVFRWFGTFEGSVFNDVNENGFRDPGEVGIVEQTLNLRFRDGTIYQSQPTDPMGEYAFTEVFPFFKWLVAEVDFARYKATGMTAVIDDGGQILPDNGWDWPSFDVLNPQPQATLNPNTGNNLSRTETGPVLTQAMHLFLNQTNVIDWGKTVYAPGENGGISGVAYYDTTRAENDPSTNAPETWQPGIPNVQIALYLDNIDNATGLNVPDGIIDDVNRDGAIRRADIDNYPQGWADGGARGPEDVDRNNNGTFNPGDAVAIVYTDSWDKAKPTDCVQYLPVVHGKFAGMCMDNYGAWNQVRPGIFDGGYAFVDYVPTGLASRARAVPLATGTYIVEAGVSGGYELVKEEDKNVDFGDEYTPSLLLLPPPCVGDPHLVPGELSLFPGIAPLFAGQTRPLCDRKQVRVNEGKNAASDFYFFTHVPKAARAVGFVNNDLAAEFNMASPNFGEKLSPSWIPVAFKDWTGKEITRVYADEYGGYNALLPSTFTMNIAMPSGVAPNMMTLVLNDPTLPNGQPDPFHNPTYSVTPWTFHYYPGTTSYLDTPLVPLAAFAGHGTGLDTEAQSGTPAIKSVSGPESGGGPVLCSDGSTDRTISLASMGSVEILNPNFNALDNSSPFRIRRDYGFGAAAGQVTLDGVPLPIVSWTDALVRVSVPGGMNTTGRLQIARSTGVAAEVGVTLSIVDCATTEIRHVPAQFTTIQAAIDDAPPGALILVAPGTYNENVIMYKPLRLQGSGAGGTLINGNPNPVERLQAWHTRMDAFGALELAAFLGRDPNRENEAPAVVVFGQTTVGGETFDPGFPFDTPGQARVDGFTLLGSKAGGGLFALSGARDLVVSNNVVTNNQGIFGGGIILGVPDADGDGGNANIAVRQNKIHRNGGTQGPGGIALNEYSSYLVEENIVAGNLSRFNGGGIAHRGYSPGENIIRKNRILYNENFAGAPIVGAGDGAGIFVGGKLVGGTGSGNVTIDANLIQGNLAGAGHGGGIRAFAMNGQDVRDSADPADWNTLTITNNMIVNNVAGFAGAGISLQDVLRARIENNTIANNDATATGALAFTAGQLNSNPQPAGVVSYAHSPVLLALLPGTEPGYSDPVLTNNIIWHNRSFFNDATLNGGAGGLAPNPAGPYWDLQVLGAPAAALNPENCVLSSVSGYAGNGNTEDDPLFVAGITNALTSATVIDEGGNNITVRYTPLLPTSADYHLLPSSPAIDAGQDNGVSPDFDGDLRPQDGFFDIGADEEVRVVPAAVRVVTPNGGEALPSGSTHHIFWAAPAEAHHYRVEVSTDNRASWQVLVNDLESLTYAWMVPRPNANQRRCFIRVTAFSATGVRLGRDLSDNPFTIQVVKLTSPDSGAVISGGTVYPITWVVNETSQPVTRVLLQRSTNGGRTWRTITTLPLGSYPPGSYSHSWDVPLVRAIRHRVLIRVTLFAGPTGRSVVGRDINDVVFSLRP